MNPLLSREHLGNSSSTEIKCCFSTSFCLLPRCNIPAFVAEPDIKGLGCTERFEIAKASHDSFCQGRSSHYKRIKLTLGDAVIATTPSLFSLRERGGRWCRAKCMEVCHTLHHGHDSMQLFSPPLDPLLDDVPPSWKCIPLHQVISRWNGAFS